MSRGFQSSAQLFERPRRGSNLPLESKGAAQGRVAPARNGPSQPVKNLPSSPREARTFGKAPVILLGCGVALLSGYSTLLYTNYKREAAKAKNHHVPADVSDRYERIAEHFDEDVDRMEWYMGMGRMRRKLVQQARGDVLEVSVGTARNLPYYPLGKCRSITMVDQSPKMIEIAMKKWNKLKGHERVDAYFRRQSALDSIKSPSNGGFHCVVQTMGLCSTPEPEKLLQNLGDVAKEEGGQIFLLEHGRSHYEWLNNILDNLAPAHADRHGCWWNKDIGAIVEKSGLEVVNLKRYHFGTTWWVELRPKKKPLPKSAEAAPQVARMEAHEKRWWSSIWG